MFEMQLASGEVNMGEEVAESVARELGEKRIDSQVVLHVYNKWTMESTLVNPLRTKRSVRTDDGHNQSAITALVAASRHDCDLCSYSSRTATNTFGRLVGRSAVTGSPTYLTSGKKT